MIHTTCVKVCVNGLWFRVEGTYTPGRPGRYCGPPEDCYPDEPAEFEVLRVWYVGGDGEEAFLPSPLLESVYAGEWERVPRLDGTTRRVLVAGDTMLETIASAAAEVAEECYREARFAAAEEKVVDILHVEA